MTLKGGYQRRPDIVLYLNGLAIAVLELKRSSVEVIDGVRQLITNQDRHFGARRTPREVHLPMQKRVNRGGAL